MWNTKKIRISVQPKDRVFVKGYGFLSFAKNMDKNIEIYIYILSEFSFTDTDDSQGSRGKERTIFYSTIPLPPAYYHSDIYFATLHWDDYHIF